MVGKTQPEIWLPASSPKIILLINNKNIYKRKCFKWNSAETSGAKREYVLNFLIGRMIHILAI